MTKKMNFYTMLNCEQAPISFILSEPSNNGNTRTKEGGEKKEFFAILNPSKSVAKPSAIGNGNTTKPILQRETLDQNEEIIDLIGENRFTQPALILGTETFCYDSSSSSQS